MKQEKSEHTATPDDENPEFMFNCTATKLLGMAVREEIDLRELAKKELANRGLNAYGKWVGFDKAKDLHGINP